ncbi:MAG TPA: right-handed parallel beta-helix repeat-containing protein [Bryobacteraceae bacterium]|nr:right-handed parallel beta-helix repeat-containing protein [Bryobacteraceae bacterium]
MRLAAVTALLVAAVALVWRQPPAGTTAEAVIRRALRTGATIELAAGMIEIQAEIDIPTGATDIEIRGAASGSTLRASNQFQGRAIFSCERTSRIRFANFAIDGNRLALEQRSGLPGFSTPFARFTKGNGILAVGVASLKISDVQFVNVPGFAIVVSRSRDIAIENVQVVDSGSRTPAGRNNATGGILLEEGTRDFTVTRCDLRNVRGNGIWTHSLATAAQNRDGLIASNHFERIGRDAIQVGRGARVHVEDNTGNEIGYPLEAVDMEHLATPVAMDTAGDTSDSEYARNQFSEVNGKCLDLDGFHDGKVRGNVCTNHDGPEHYPDGNLGIVFNNSDPAMHSQGIELEDNTLDGTLFTGIFLIGEHHRIAHNRLRRINLAHCNGKTGHFGCNYAPDQPGLLRSGIYLAKGGEYPSPARANVIEDNEISGFGMSAHCINVAPGVSIASNTIVRNVCKDNPAQ